MSYFTNTTSSIVSNVNPFDTYVSASLSASNQTLVNTLLGHKSATTTVAGNWTGSLIVESTTDVGTTWVACWIQSITAQQAYVLVQPTNVITANGAWSIFATSGITGYRVRVSGSLQGTASVGLTSTEQPPVAIFATTATTQNVIPDSLNSSTTNLSASNSFTGSSVSTLGVNSIQIAFKSDQNFDVYIDQSNDQVNWDVSDHYFYYPNNSFGITTTAIGAYYRVRIKNSSPFNNPSTYLRLSSVLCPIANAQPRSLDEYGKLQTAIKSIGDSYNNIILGTQTGDLRVANPYLLVGSSFTNATNIDPNFWVTSSNGNVTASQGNACITLSTTGSSCSASLQTYRTARYVVAFPNSYHGQIQLSDTGSSNINITRRWGAYNLTDGCFFELSGSQLAIVTRANSVDTRVPYTSWNGNLLYPTLNNTTTYDINYRISQVHFIVNKQILHSVDITNAHWTTNINLPARMEIINASGVSNSAYILTRSTTIHRLGNSTTNPSFSHITTAGTYVLKYGPGILHTIVINDPGGTAISVYDSTGGATNPIAIIPSTKFPNAAYLTYEISFNNGLTLVTTGTWDLTISYE